MGKIKGIFIFLILTITLSCGEECLDLPATLIGTWEMNTRVGDIIFQDDGTFIDDAAIIISVSATGGDIEKTWTVTENSVLTCTATSGSNTASTVFNVPTFDCDLIDLEIQGLEFILSRK